MPASLSGSERLGRKADASDETESLPLDRLVRGLRPCSRPMTPLAPARRRARPRPQDAARGDRTRSAQERAMPGDAHGGRGSCAPRAARRCEMERNQDVVSHSSCSLGAGSRVTRASMMACPVATGMRRAIATSAAARRRLKASAVRLLLRRQSQSSFRGDLAPPLNVCLEQGAERIGR